ncbi:MAG: alanine:cation symporter family protein [Ruminococcaceae bacterium]|nr:alanine:cation symporter family protein [Oscillospiraceae bacterium]
MKLIETVISAVNDALYGYILIIVLVLAGLYFTVRTRGVQIGMLPEQVRTVTEKPKEKGGVSSFRSLMVSTASRVGTGNIIGVSTALCMGGFGSVFWMWVIAIIGGASAFVESTLGQIYKKRGKSESYGGPAYYIEQGLGIKWLAAIFSVLLILTYGVGFNMLASYNLQSTFSGYRFYNAAWTPWVIGGAVAILVAVCLFGGGRRILSVTGVLVPVMGLLYILVALVISLMNITSLPAILVRIFREAFDLSAIFGGFGGSCVMYGIKRGLFSNEAGVGSAPNAAASADVSHPVKQGLTQTLSVFIDTLLVCSATAFMCMASGIEPTEALSGAPYVQAALAKSLGGVGPIFITVSMALFAFTTLVGNLFYVNQAWAHLFRRTPSKLFNYVYYTVAAGLILLGAGLSANLLWNLADLLMGLMALINIPVILILGGQAYRALKDYRRQKKQGLDPVFRAKDIGIEKPLDYWTE